MKYLIKRLDENQKTYISARQIFTQVETAVINNTSNVPQYGTIQNAGDEGVILSYQEKLSWNLYFNFETFLHGFIELRTLKI